MADQNENPLTLQQLNQVLGLKLGLQTETLTNKMGQVFEDKMNQVFEDKMNQVFEDKLQIAEGESVNLPNVERQVGLLLGATPDAILGLQTETLTNKMDQVFEDKMNQVLGLQTETLTNKMGQVFEDKLNQVFEDKLNQVFEDKLKIAEGESVNLPNVERQVGLLLGATPSRERGDAPS